ncbi:hypothetical protein [Nostoc sp. PA-18-2419]|uniref:hypothetical protein n=1 Tax=Nostoc sp. PA-18-2419 TaxID=2575443 RepID=UPI00167A00C4|nr:hypothetical protein [Nostoc sp. PA-18-2419]
MAQKYYFLQVQALLLVLWQKAVLTGGKTITIPSIHAYHYVLKDVITAITSAFDK